MKAVLEFSYPEDERKLLFALNGAKMYQALTDIKLLARSGYSAVIMDRIEQVVDEALNEVHK
jgi:hypothetical protein